MSQPKVAIVADWLTNMSGAENVVLAMHDAFPDAPIYTSTFARENMPAFHNLDVRTTFLQKLPGPLKKLHKLFPTLRVTAFRRLDLSGFDVILSSSSAESKQVRKTHPDQIHICYCHTPIRYYWSHYNEYKKNPSFGKLNWLIRLLMPLFVPPMRRADFRAAQNVDLFIANSEEVKKRIKKYYHKDAVVVHPPVDIKKFKPSQKRENFYMTLCRQIPYKRIDLVVEAATKLNINLKVFGSGPEHEKLIAIAGPTVQFLSGSDQKENITAYNSTKGFIFPAEEDFGIVSVEALAGGAPVIGYARGGTLDIVEDLETGVLFKEQALDDLVKAIKTAETINFSPFKLNNRSKRFDKSLFITKIRKIVKDNHKI
jgi:Glycosyltransferase